MSIKHGCLLSSHINKLSKVNLVSVPVSDLPPPLHLQRVHARLMESPTLDPSIHCLKDDCVREESTTDRS